MWLNIGLILLFAGLCVFGILLLINAKRINNKIFDWSVRQQNPFANEGQRKLSLRSLRFVGALLIGTSILFDYFLITDFIVQYL